MRTLDIVDIMRQHSRKNTTVNYQIDGQFLTPSQNAQGGKAVEEV